MDLNLILYSIMNFLSIQYHTRTVVVLNCMSKYENVNLLKLSSRGGVSLLSIPLQNYGLETTMDLIQKSTKAINSVGIIFDANCLGSMKFLISCMTKRCFDEKFKWFILENELTMNQSTTLKLIKTTNIFMDARIMYLNFNEMAETNTGSRVYKLYNICNNAFRSGGKAKLSMDGCFIIDHENNVHIVENLRLNQRRSMNRDIMNDVTLRIGIFMQNPERFPSNEARMEYLQSDNNTAIDTLRRFPVNALTPVGEMFGSKILYEIYNDGTDDETHHDAIQEMVENKVDFLFSFIVLNPELLSNFTPVTQVLELRSFFFFRTSIERSMFQYYFLRPFERHLWFGLILIIILIGLLMWFILSRKLSINVIDTNPLEISCAFMVTFGAFCQQGACFSPKLMSGRCLFICLFFSSILIYNYYTSLLVSILVQSNSKNDIKTMTDLADSKFEIAFDNVSYARSFFNSTSCPAHEYFIKKKLNPKSKSETIFLPLTEGLKRAQNQKKFAFHCEALAAFPIIRDTFEPEQLCDLNVIPSRENTLLAIAVPKESPMKDAFATKVFWLRETGILSKHSKRWVSDKPPCLYSSIFVGVGLDYVAGMLGLLLFSYLIATILLICEIIFFRLTSRRF